MHFADSSVGCVPVPSKPRKPWTIYKLLLSDALVDPSSAAITNFVKCIFLIQIFKLYMIRYIYNIKSFYIIYS